jgi:hypothetical protein
VKRRRKTGDQLIAERRQKDRIERRAARATCPHCSQTSNAGRCPIHRPADVPFSTLLEKRKLRS